MDLNAILAVLGKEGTDEEKAKELHALHKSGVEGLEKAKDKILTEKKAEQEKHAKLAGEIEAEREATEARLKEIEGQVGKAGTEEAQKAFEAQLAREAARFEAKAKKDAEALAEWEQKHSALLERRRKDLVKIGAEAAITKLGITDPIDRENAIEKFLYNHGKDFKPGDDDEIPVNTDFKTVEEVLNQLAATPQYQKFIPAKNNGGGASGGSHAGPMGKNVVSREKFDSMTPQEKTDFSLKGGTIG